MTTSFLLAAITPTVSSASFCKRLNYFPLIAHSSVSGILFSGLVVTSLRETYLTAKVPAGATTGPVSVVTSRGTVPS